MPRILSTLLTLIALFLPGLAMASGMLSPQERMDVLQREEHNTLGYRDELLRLDEQFADPVWIRLNNSSAFVMDGSILEQRIISSTNLIHVLGLNRAVQIDAIFEFPFGRLIYAALERNNGDIQFTIQEVIDDLYAESGTVRQQALNDIETNLTMIRDDFQRAMAERDGKRPSGGSADVSIVGTWKNCDGRTIAFSGDAGGYTGTYVTVNGLEGFGFKAEDIGFQNFRQTENPGEYSGEAEWRFAGGAGKPWWQPETIRVANGVLTFGAGGPCASEFDRQN